MSLMIQQYKPNSYGYTDKCLVRKFQYLTDVSKWIEEHKPLSRDGDQPSSEKPDYDYGDGGWYMTNSLTEAIELLNKGWDISNEIKDISNPIFEEMSAQIEREDINYDVHGDYIDIERFSEGEPECWGQFSPHIVETKGKSKVLKIVINVCASAGVQASVMKRKGVLAATLVRLLEFAGYRCEVWCVDARANHAYDENKFQAQEWFHIKHPDQYLDEQRMCFAMAHPSFLRRICFAISERYNDKDATEVKFWRECGGGHYGYGMPDEAHQEDQGDIYINSAYLNIQWTTQEKAVEWLKGKLKEQGVRFKDEQ